MYCNEPNNGLLKNRQKSRNKNGHGGSPQYWVSHVDGEEDMSTKNAKRNVWYKIIYIRKNKCTPQDTPAKRNGRHKIHLFLSFSRTYILWRTFLYLSDTTGLYITTSTKISWELQHSITPLCTNRLNWVRRTSWGWWDEWDDTVLQTQDSKFEHAISRSRRLPTILSFRREWGRNIFVSFKPSRPGTEPPDGVRGSGVNHYPRAPAQWLHRGLQHSSVKPKGSICFLVK